MMQHVILLPYLRLNWPDTCCSAGKPPLQKEVRTFKSADPHFAVLIHNFLLLSKQQCYCVILSGVVQPPHSVTALSCATHFSHDRLCSDSSPVLIVITLSKTITTHYFSLVT